MSAANIVNEQKDPEQNQAAPNNQDSAESRPSASKRRKTGASKATKLRGKRGLLRQLTEVPIDILFEIFGYLAPGDLLRLARTTKTLRGLLMARSASSVWKTARSNIPGFPDLPSDMSEPAFASLIFDTVCHGCNAPNVKSVIFFIRRRYCKKCLLSPAIFRYFHPSWKADKLVPGALADADVVYTKFITGSSRRDDGFRYHIPTTTLLVAEYHALPENEVEDWIAQKKAEKAQREEQALICERWLEERRNDRAEELEDIRLHRRQDIMQRLEALGWGHTLTRMKTSPSCQSALFYHKQVAVSKKLTSKAWNLIQDELVSVMQDIERRLGNLERTRTLKARAEVLRELLGAYRSSLPFNSIIPSNSTIASLEPFAAILCSSDSSEVNQDSFDSAMNSLSRLIAEWRDGADVALVKILGRNSDHSNSLSLAKTRFSCTGCLKDLSYPRVLVHVCRSSLFDPYHFADSDFEEDLDYSSNKEEKEMRCIDNVFRSKQWSPESFEKSQRTSGPLGVLALLGLDSNTTTNADLNTLNPLLQYETTGPTGRIRTVMRWEKAFASHKEATSVLSDPQEQVCIEAAEKERFRDTIDNPRYLTTRLGCAHCDKSFFPNQLRDDHLPSCHSISEPDMSDFEWPLDTDKPFGIFYLEGKGAEAKVVHSPSWTLDDPFLGLGNMMDHLFLPIFGWAGLPGFPSLLTGASTSAAANAASEDGAAEESAETGAEAGDTS